MLEALARQAVTQLEQRTLVLERENTISKLQELEKGRLEKDRAFRQLFDSIDDGFCIVELKYDGGSPVDYRFLEVNSAFTEQTGLVAVQGKWIRDLAPDHEQHWFDIYGQVALSGEPVRFERPAKELGDRWYEVQAFRVGDPGAHQVGILFRDATRRKSEEVVRLSTEALQETVNQELNHRMKNIFSMVQAIVTQTFRGADDQALVQKLTERLRVLSTAHDALLEHSWTRSELGTLAPAVVSTLAPLSRIEIDGPSLFLGPKSTLSTTLVLHELTSNALKYGALSNGQGRVTITWIVEGELLVLRWNEIGGPAVQPSDRKGFGSKLITFGLCGTGGTEVHYRSSGLQANFVAPLAQIQSI